VTKPDVERLVEAIERLQASDWPAAHRLVQDLDEPLACRIHGLVHRIQGDLADSRYWYSRAGSKLDEARRIEDEIDELRRDLKASG
jgi:hypothetical protein